MLFLITHCGFPLNIAAIGAVIMAHKETHLIGQSQNFLNAVIERACVPAWEIRPRRAAIRHEQRVAHKGRIPNHMGHASGRVARGVDYKGT